MGKGDRTREKIIEQAAELFNCQGYFGASMSDIMRVTGLNKGGIYNHFESKQDLAVESFDYAIDLISRRMSLAIENATNAADRLLAVISVIENLGEDNPIPGGCPLLNTAVESDDAHPVLRERARLAMTRWRNRIRRITKEGIKAGEINSSVDGDVLATILIATLEGAVMMSKLYDNPVHMRRAVGHLKQYIETAVRAR
ncbi:MAG: TetR/AcrR family transcriptional regulator, transcriptional repressor for nem operon [Blastocatellia bacterium]|nr:TetR/AcrR family transcriptional regulator, transcriptional repressor for nem operon [Blastocatellia bacterium]